MFRLYTLLLSLALLNLLMPGRLLAGDFESSVVGTMVSVVRVVEEDCDRLDDDGRCSFDAIGEGLKNLKSYMHYFDCVSATSKPDIELDEQYEALSEHDKGPVAMVKAASVRCAADPRIELFRVEKSNLGKECSRLGWKCNLIWIPDYDPSVVFVGRLPH